MSSITGKVSENRRKVATYYEWITYKTCYAIAISLVSEKIFFYGM